MRLKTASFVFSTICIMILCFWKSDARPQQTRPGCWYEGKRYQEGQVVNTTKPCLRCRCNEGSLRCGLRICPRLPSPVPFGCTTRTPRNNACCAELLCGNLHERNVTATRDPSKDMRRQDEGCLHEGVRYGPGSAMMGSRRCEYCYCISGTRRCLRPRCLLPLVGCTPLYAPYSCCPVAYNCTKSPHHSLPSVTNSSLVSRNGCRVGNRTYKEGEMVKDIEWKGPCDNCFCAMGGVRCVPLSCAPPLQGCTPIVRQGHCCPSTYNCSGNIEVKAAQNYASYAFISKDYAKFRKETNFYSMPYQEVEGSIGNSTVEGRGHKNPEEQSQTNSTSLKSLLRFVNATKASNVSLSTDSEISESMENLTTVMTNNATIMFENTTEKLTTTSNQDHETMNNEIPTETQKIDKFSNQQETTFPMDWINNESTEFPTTLEPTTSFDLTSDSTTLTNDETVGFTNSFGTREDSSESSLIPVELSTTLTNNDITTLDYSGIDYTTEIYEEEKKTSSLPELIENIKNVDSKDSEKKTTTRRAIESTTKFTKLDDIRVDNAELEKDPFAAFGIGESSVISVKGPVTGSPTTVLMPDNMFVINVTLRTNVSVGHIQGITSNPVRSISPDIEAILNITNRKKGEDYDYDYSQPTLPPSLPNVRIIPFVAADALVKQDEKVSSQVTNYPLGPPVGLAPQDLGATVASGTRENFYDIVTQKNRFSPPIETEVRKIQSSKVRIINPHMAERSNLIVENNARLNGGFVPRDPSYFDPPFRSSDHNVGIHSGVTSIPADITNPHRKNDELAGICMFENRNYRHGDILPSSGHCIICICYYGEVACSDEKCPPLKIGCSRVKNDKICCGKVICVNAEESPTLVLDRADAIAPSPREPLPSLDGMASPDPFRDVIKTKPAPDLPSLIEDMIPYLVEHRITKPAMLPTTQAPTTDNSGSSVAGNFDGLTDHRVDPGRIGLQEVPFTNAHVPKPSNVNNTTMNQVSHKTSVFDVANPTSSNDHEHKETSTNAEVIGVAPVNPSQLPTVNMENDEESSIFSFGSVLDLLFSENSGSEGTTETPSHLHKPTANMSPHSLPNVPSTYPANQPIHFMSNKPADYGPRDPPTISSGALVDFHSQPGPHSRLNMTSDNSGAAIPGHSLNNAEPPQDKLYDKLPGLSSISPSSFPSKLSPATSAGTSLSKLPFEAYPQTRINATPEFFPEPDAAQLARPSTSENQPPINDSSMSATTIAPGMSTKAESITWIKIKDAQRTSTSVPEDDDSWVNSDSRETTATGSVDNDVVTSVSGLLKLAGCNIYGRMYRVGRIITELSSPCLECRCTEVGVQCKQLQC